MKKILLLTPILFTCAVLSPLSYAATASGNFQLSSNVESTCVITNTYDARLGRLNTVDETKNNGWNGSQDYRGYRTTATVSVKCTAGTSAASMMLNEGANPAAGSTCEKPSRRMKSAAGDYFSYQIALTEFGDLSSLPSVGCSPTNAISLPEFTKELGQSHTDLVVYYLDEGNVRAGSYSDTVGVTVLF